MNYLVRVVLILDNFSLAMALWDGWQSIPSVREANAAAAAIGGLREEYNDLTLLSRMFAFDLTTDLILYLSDEGE